MSYNCNVHGKLKSLNFFKTPRYCPICGREVIKINFFPLANIYIDKLAALVVGIFILAWFFIFNPLKIDYELESTKTYNCLPNEWKSTYDAAIRMPVTQKRAEIIIKTSPKLGETRNLSNKEINLFLDMLVGESRAEAYYYLYNYRQKDVESILEKE